MLVNKYTIDEIINQNQIIFCDLIINIYKKELSFKKTKSHVLNLVSNVSLNYFNEARLKYLETLSVKEASVILKEELDKLLLATNNYNNLLNNDLVALIYPLFNEYFNGLDKNKKHYYGYYPNLNDKLGESFNIFNIYCSAGELFYQKLWSYVTNKEIIIKSHDDILNKYSGCSFSVIIKK